MMPPPEGLHDSYAVSLPPEVGVLFDGLFSSTTESSKKRQHATLGYLELGASGDVTFQQAGNDIVNKVRKIPSGRHFSEVVKFDGKKLRGGVPIRGTLRILPSGRVRPAAKRKVVASKSRAKKTPAKSKIHVHEKDIVDLSSPSEPSAAPKGILKGVAHGAHAATAANSTGGTRTRPKRKSPSVRFRDSDEGVISLKARSRPLPLKGLEAPSVTTDIPSKKRAATASHSQISRGVGDVSSSRRKPTGQRSRAEQEVKGLAPSPSTAVTAQPYSLTIAPKFRELLRGLEHDFQGTIDIVDSHKTLVRIAACIM